MVGTKRSWLPKLYEHVALRIRGCEMLEIETMTPKVGAIVTVPNLRKIDG